MKDQIELVLMSCGRSNGVEGVKVFKLALNFSSIRMFNTTKDIRYVWGLTARTVCIAKSGYGRVEYTLQTVSYGSIGFTERKILQEELVRNDVKCCLLGQLSIYSTRCFILCARFSNHRLPRRLRAYLFRQQRPTKNNKNNKNFNDFPSFHHLT